MYLEKGSSIKTSDDASERIIETLDTKLNLILPESNKKRYRDEWKLELREFENG